MHTSAHRLSKTLLGQLAPLSTIGSLCSASPLLKKTSTAYKKRAQVTAHSGVHQFIKLPTHSPRLLPLFTLHCPIQGGKPSALLLTPDL